MLRYFLQFLLTLLSYVTPKDKRLLVFGCGNRNEFQGHPKYLYLYLHKQQHTDWKYVWNTEDRILYDELKVQGYPVIYKYSVTGFFMLLRARLFIHEKSSKDVYYIDQIVGRFRFFQTFHGVPLKMIGLDRIKFVKKGIFYKITKHRWLYNLVKNLKLLSMFKYKAMLASSEEVRRVMQRAFDHPNVLMLGYPRNDLFFDKSLLYKDLRTPLRLDGYEKVILYAPTFRDHQGDVRPFTIDFLLELNEFCEAKDYLFLLKKHPWEKRLMFPDYLTNLQDVSDQVSDVQELLIWTDVLVTDYSSVFFDFMISERPVIFYAYDLEDYKVNARDLYYPYEPTVQGPIAQNEKQLLRLLDDLIVWSLEESYQKRYQEVNDKFNTYNDGKACERVIAAIEEI